jgi:cytochrome c-type biogenesis protein CcmH/NrfG
MFSSRNIHFAILGIILGASSGYVFAFYRAQSAQTPPSLTETQANADMPVGHPEVNNEQMLAAMKKAVEADPNQPEVVKRYAMALFDAGHFDEAGKWFGKAVELEPKNVDTRSMYGAVLWRMGDKEGAGAQLEETLKIDPRNIPSLHGLALLAIEKRDAVRAAQLIKQIEGIEPAYGQLPELRTRLQGIRGGQ